VPYDDTYCEYCIRYGWCLVSVSGNKNTKKFIRGEYTEDVILRTILEIENLSK